MVVSLPNGQPRGVGGGMQYGPKSSRSGTGGIHDEVHQIQEVKLVPEKIGRAKRIVGISSYARSGFLQTLVN